MKKNTIAFIDGSALKELVIDNIKDNPVALVQIGNDYFLESTVEESAVIELATINEILKECK